ncbi:glycosyltransferase family 4 protein [Dietzia cercidiphylli]|uniref:glycosyltransferase family 4 protein n=1 Tax=Dietzia cercidiphylli TaxID=498199 RepID=UPI00223C067C|nr:glycosyltransferase family 4 protein [Dietzia cercidiphylli]MCT1517047.1 glycosyltransferase family 4 protein [Dietzia cercidiphylli]
MARILLLCWRDSTHPQGGGSERYLEHVADGLAAAGHTVIYRTSRPRGAPRSEVRPTGRTADATGPGVTVSRGGGRFTVYPRALGAMLLGRLGLGPLGALRKPDVVVDTQNGVPFFARLATTAPVVVLVHHIHREQWPVAGWLVARIGWWIESWLSPRVHSGSQYVTVSLPSADELADLGVDPARIAVVRNGLDPLPSGVRPGSPGTRAEGPHLVVLSRLVPHKHVEDALDVLAALRATHPGLVLDVIGSGWWSDRLREYAGDLGLDRGPDQGPDGAGTRHPAGAVVFHGHVDEATKHRLLAAASLHLMPSRKEGWGLAVSEAAQHGVPTIGYHHAAGLRDSIDDGETGLLVDDVAAMTAATERLLADAGLRDRMGEAARRKAAGLSWPATGAAMAEVLTAVTEGRRVSGVIGGPPRPAPSPPRR